VNILGLDLSMTATGICLPDGTTFTVKTKLVHKDHRLSQIERAVSDCLRGVDLAVIERSGRFQGDTGYIIGMVHGVVRNELAKAGVPFVILTPATIKKFATGNGGCKKEPMAEAALKLAGRRFADDDQCDAWWLQRAALHHYGVLLSDLPEKQLEALDKPVWPVLPRAVAA
jgi:Holliday junction resolvasome RuvABC endonuclease subunit